MKKYNIGNGDNTVDSKFKTKMYKTKAISTKVQSSSSESDDHMSDFCKHFIKFQLNCVTYLNMRLFQVNCILIL